jgi:hypothetical protein
MTHDRMGIIWAMTRPVCDRASIFLCVSAAEFNCTINAHRSVFITALFLHLRCICLESILLLMLDTRIRSTSSSNVHGSGTPAILPCLCFLSISRNYNIFLLNPFQYITQLTIMSGARGSVVVEALCYKPEGRGFETWWGEWISRCITPWGLLSF